MKRYSRVLIVSEKNGAAKIEHHVSAPNKKIFDRYLAVLKQQGYRVRVQTRRSK